MSITLMLTLLLLASCFICRPGVAYASERRVPDLPPADVRLRLLVDTDAACEIDDLYAIALAITSQDRFEIEGFVGAHFGDAGGAEGVARSVDAIHEVLANAGVDDDYMVLPGAPPFQFSEVPPAADGVDFIIDRAMASADERPLWVVSLGACTNVVAAYLKQPAIARRINVLWHGRTQWPERCWNFNAYNDLKAVRILMTSDIPLVLFDTGTYLRCPMEESAREMRPQGKLGRYLHDFRFRNEHYQSPMKGFFDLGDIAALVDPSLVYSEVVNAPMVDWDMRYVHNGQQGKMRRIYQIDRDRTFALLYERLKRWAQARMDEHS